MLTLQLRPSIIVNFAKCLHGQSHLVKRKVRFDGRVTRVVFDAQNVVAVDELEMPEHRGVLSVLYMMIIPADVCEAAGHNPRYILQRFQVAMHHSAKSPNVNVLDH